MVFLCFPFYFIFYVILSLGNGIDNNAAYFIPLLRGSDQLTLVSIWYVLAIIISYEEPYEVSRAIKARRAVMIVEKSRNFMRAEPSCLAHLSIPRTLKRSMHTVFLITMPDHFTC